jgi:5-methylcytosine-specific restriction protein A
MKRHRLTTAKRVACFRDNNGECHLCGGKIHAGEAWEVSHPIPLELGGADDKSNWRPAHRVCHRVETSTKDIPAIAKAKRREARHIGALKSSRPFPKRAKPPRIITKRPVPRRDIYIGG